jgi:Flp pilus assembly protein TadD
MRVVCSVLIGILGVAQYWNSLSNDLVFDDHLAIRGNDDVDHTKTAWTSLLTHDFWGKDLRQIDSHKSYRPLTVATFRLNHMVAEGFDASQMHLTNAVLHGITCIVFFFLSLALFDDTRAAIIGGLLFATHPVHVEAITGVVGRSEPLCATFSMVCFLSYRRAVLVPGEMTKFFFGAISVSMFVLATLSKEIGITIIGVIAVYDLFMAPASSAFLANDYVPVWHSHASVSSRCWLVARFLLLLGLMASYLCTRLLLMSEVGLSSTSGGSVASAIAIIKSGSWANATLNQSELIRKTENPFIFTHGLSRVLSLMYLHWRYLLLLLYPAEMCAEYSFNCIPAVRSLADVRNVSSFAAYLGMLALGLGSIYRAVSQPRCGGRAGERDEKADSANAPREAKAPAADFRSAGELVGLAWMLLPFIPASGVFVTVGTLLAERLLYIPSIGFCLLVGRAMAMPLAKKQAQQEEGSEVKGQEAGAPAAMGEEEARLKREQQQKELEDICAELDGAEKEEGDNSGRNAGIRSASRAASASTVTSSDKSSSSSTSKGTTSASTSTAFIIWGLVGVIIAVAFRRTCLRTNDWATDESLFASAVEVCPNSAKMHQQYGQVMLNRHNVTGAFAHFRRAQTIDPEMCDVEFSIGMAYAGLNDYGAAARFFTKSLHCKFTNMKAFDSLQKIWQAYRDLNPANITLHAEMGETLAVIEQNETAVVHLREAGVLSLKQAASGGGVASQRHKEAAHWFKRALVVIPTRCDIRYWQGKNFIQQGRLAKAAKVLEKGTRPHCEQNEVVSSGGELVQVYMHLLAKQQQMGDGARGAEGGKVALRTIELQRGLGRAISGVVGAHEQSGGEQDAALVEYRKTGGQYWHQAGVSLAKLSPPRHDEAVQCFTEALVLSGTQQKADEATEQTEQQCLHRLWLAQSLIAMAAPGQVEEVIAQLHSASMCAGTGDAAKKQLLLLETHGGGMMEGQ